MAHRAHKILVVDDSADDVLLLRRAFAACAGAEIIGVLSDGQQVMDYFDGKGKYADRQAHPAPDVLILDLKIPVRSGFEVLEYLRARLSPMPCRVVILTSFAQPSDIQRSYELGAHLIAHKEADLRPLAQRLEREMNAPSRALASSVSENCAEF